MTIPNRTVAITGVFAEDAITTIPVTPVPGVGYRDTTMTPTEVKAGWGYKDIVDSSKFNEALYEYSSVTQQVEKYGFLPWSALTDYVIGSVALGSDGKLYQAKQATGPSSTAYDPTTNPSVWESIILGNTNYIFENRWSDYEINSQNWLRADTFSWQPGTTYTNAYGHLVDDIAGISPSTETVGSYTITYYQAADGHKIVMANQETTVANIYAESGVAWYYILDTDNTRFKLPRSTHGNIVEKYTNGTDWYRVWSDGWCEQGGHISSNGSVTLLKPFSDTNYSLMFGSYGNDSGVPRANTKTTTGFQYSSANQSNTDSDWTAFGYTTPILNGEYRYLYFYVGQFSQSATEETAGLNAALFNAKADLDLSNGAANASTYAKQTIASWNNVDYSAGVSIPNKTTYTCTAPGMIFATLRCAANQDSDITVNGVTITEVMAYQSTIAQGEIAFPVSTGDVVYVKSTHGTATPTITFYPKGV